MQPAVQTPPKASRVRQPTTTTQRHVASRCDLLASEGQSSRIGAADWCVLLLTFAATALFSATWSPDWLSVDTAQTLSVARNIAAHGTIATDIIYYEEHLQFSKTPVPQTVFPPGYTGLIAALMSLGVSDVLAARIVVTLSFALVPLLLLWILRRVKLSAACAVFICLVWLGMQPMWWNAQGIQSELPFIACTLGVFTCQLKADDKACGWRWMLAAGVLTALACSIRYAGVFFALAVGLVLAVDWIIRRTNRSLLRSAVFCIPPLLAVAVMFARNASLVGDMKGGNNHLTTKPLSEVLRTAWYSLTDLWGWSRSGLMNGETSELLLLVGAFVAIYTVMVRARTSQPVVRTSFQGNADMSTWFLPVTYCGVTLASLIWLESTTSVGLCSRLLLPMVPFLLICFAQMLKWFEERTYEGGMRLVPIAVALLAMLTGQMELWAKHDQPTVVARIRAAVDELSEPHSQPSWSELIALSDGRPVLCNECHCVSNVTQIPVVGLAHEMYTSRTWNHKNVRELVDQFDIHLVLVFPEVFDDANESTHYFEELLVGDVPSWLTPVISAGPVRVYVVEPVGL